MKRITCAIMILIVLSLLCAVSCVCADEKALSSLQDYPHFVEIPLIRQGTTYACGIACLHSIFLWLSPEMDINDALLSEACGTTEDNGTSYIRILQYMQETGGPEATWHEGITIDALKDVVDNGGVVMMPIQAWEYKETASDVYALFDTEDYIDYWAGGHWVIACGYNDNGTLFMDPSTGGCYASLSWDALDVRWHDSPDYSEGAGDFTRFVHCGIVVYQTGAEPYNHNVVRPLE